MTLVFMYYCYMLLESSMCPFQPRLHLCKRVQCVILHTSYDKMMACSFVVLVISQHFAFWKWMWKAKLCLTKTTHHTLMSPLKKGLDSTFDSFRWGDIFIHALGKQINYCPFVEGHSNSWFNFSSPKPMTSLVFKNILEIET
jgi:hypothetical protein